VTAGVNAGAGLAAPAAAPARRGPTLGPAAGALLALVLLVAANAAFTPGFATAANLWNVLLQVAEVLLVAVGMTLVVATGGDRPERGVGDGRGRRGGRRHARPGRGAGGGARARRGAGRRAR
jgi:hypothetical protein